MNTDVTITADGRMDLPGQEINSVSESISTDTSQDFTRTEKVDRDDRATVGDITHGKPRMVCRDVNVYYGDKLGVKDISIDIVRNEVLAMIGPSGCGKSTFLKYVVR